jgi:peptide/nickel transport system permease protein
MESAARTLSTRSWIPRPAAPSGFAIAGAAIVLLGLVAVAAPLIAPHDPTALDLSSPLAGTSGTHPLGTDASGRDLLSRLIFGARITLLGPLVVVVCSTLVGGPMGLIAGYRGGIADAVLSRLWDVLLGFPALLLAIVIVAAFGVGFWSATAAVTVIYIPILARVVRGTVLVERQKPYIEACRLQGFSEARVVGAHIVPNISGIVAAQAVLNFGYSLLDLAGLAFLGFGVQPPTADWGQMLNDGRQSLVSGAYLEVFVACVAITLTVIAFNVFGYALASRAVSRR